MVISQPQLSMDSTIGARLLIVEDDPALLEGIKTILEYEHYEVLTAQNGKEALHILNTVSPPPELVLSDIMMPEMNGLDLLRAVRLEPRWVTIPFIFLTAKGDRADIKQGRQLGVDDYLLKPFEAEELIIAIGARLKRQRSLTEAQTLAVGDLKKNILTILHHEFRTPLTFVVAYADLLNNPENYQLSNDEMLTFLKGVNNGATRLRRLIENFILLVEIESGDAQRDFVVRKQHIIDLEVLIAEACEQAFGEDPTHQVTITLGGLSTFEGERSFLRTAIVELLTNAAKFSKPNGGIDLYAGREGDEMVIAVTDHGRGIPEDEQPRVWDPFYQINRKHYEDQGTGNGLAIVRGIASLHGGRATVTSEFGKGSTFSLYLPLTTANATP